MTNKVKQLAIETFIIVAALMVSGCSLVEPEKIQPCQSLLLWVDATRAELDYYNSRISCYCEKNKNVSIQVTGIPFSDMKPRLLGQGNAGETPDIIYISSDWIGELADRKLIKPLLSPGNNLIVNKPIGGAQIGTAKPVFGRARECVTYEGRQYAVPVAYDVVTLLLNRDLVPSNPSQLSDLFGSETFKKDDLSDTSGRVWPLVYDNKNFYYHGPFYFAFNGSLPQTAGGRLFSTDSLVKSLQYTLSLEVDKKVLPVSANHSAMVSLFCSRKAKSIISGPWDYIKAKNAGINIVPVALPEIKPGHRLRSFVSVHGLAIAGTSKNDELAFDFIKFLSSDESQIIASSKIGIVPVSPAVCKGDRVEEWVKVFRREVDKGVVMPNIPDMVQVWRQMNWVLTKTFADKPVSEAVIKKMVKKASESAASATNLKAMILRKRGMP